MRRFLISIVMLGLMTGSLATAEAEQSNGGEVSVEAEQSNGEVSVRDIAGDANLINGQRYIPAGEYPTRQASYGPADIREVAFETTFKKVAVGKDGIDYQATGLKVHYRTEATPRSDGPTIFYRLRVDVDGCYSFLDAFLRGPSSGPFEPPDKSIQWNQREDICPNGGDGVWSMNTGWTVTIDDTGKELVMTFPYSTLSPAELEFMDEGSTLSAIVANTRTYIGAPYVGTDFTLQFDESPVGLDFEIGSDMPEDIPCTTGCPRAARQSA